MNKTIDAETLLNMPLPPTRWLVPDLLPAGLTMLVGASKSGKSWLCLWLCLQLAGGGEVWGRKTKPQTVLYLCLEDTYTRIQSRLFKITDETVPDSLFFQNECAGIGCGLEQQIESFLQEHPETALVVIDTLQKVRNVEKVGNAYAGDYQDMSALKALADKHNICILLVHHLRKQLAEDPFQQISGTNGLMGAADTIWLLRRERSTDNAQLLITGRDVDGRTLYLQEDRCIWILLNEESAEEKVIKEVPTFLWKGADFLQTKGAWQGTATELLQEAKIENVLPNQLTRKITEYYYTVFAPRGILYKSCRKPYARLLQFGCHDDDDANDDKDVG